MEYERIHKAQSGVLSPSKLRLKILAVAQRRKDGENGSSRSSPTKLDDSEYSENLLLEAENGVIGEPGPSKDFRSGSAVDVGLGSQESTSEAAIVKFSGDGMPDCGHREQTCSVRKDLRSKEPEVNRARFKNSPKNLNCQVQSSGNLSMVHPVKSLEEENLDYDSGHDNASSSSFEFHKGERTVHSSVLGPFFNRPVPSKWNDAEKWIVNRQNTNRNLPKKNGFQNQVNRQPGRVVPESMGSDKERFSFIPSGFQPGSVASNGPDKLIDRYPVDDDQKEMNIGELYPKPLLLTDGAASDQAGISSTVRSVSMRDMGTEMTPIASQDPSRTGTPIGATTPIRSPTSSLPSTPRRDAPGPTPAEATDDENGFQQGHTTSEMSERELQLKTRREIMALGLQLGKMNIASWASKDEGQNPPASNNNTDTKQLEKIEFETRAAAWEEAEKSKHIARYKSEEIKIQAWESFQKAKLEAEMRRIEIKVEKMRTHEQGRLMNKLASSRQQAEQKRAAAEAERDRKAAKTARQAEYIRQNGRIPSSFLCCSCFS